MLSSIAPGKLILSGEHAVVYGCPALVMAINQYVTTSIIKESSHHISLHLLDLNYNQVFDLSSLSQLKRRLKEKYQGFIRGEYSIKHVFKEPFELAQFTLALMTESFDLSLKAGFKLEVQSNLPLGCGMGSSAATIISMVQAISCYLEQALSPSELHQIALQVENMQHGNASGLDLRIAQLGGCLYMHEQIIVPRPIPPPLYFVNTGTPTSTTGQCVEKVAPFFCDSSLKNEFASVTHYFDLALQEQSWNNIQEAIQHNHQLLTRIGVVPDKVKHFITAIEAHSGAAKICGAGAISGEKAGAVLIMHQDDDVVRKLSAEFGYSIHEVICETRGVYAD